MNCYSKQKNVDIYIDEYVEQYFEENKKIFEGEKEYEKIISNKAYYIFNSNN